MTTKISERFPVNPQQPNFGKRLTLKFIAGTPALVLLPSMMLTACGGSSTNASSSSQYVSNAEEAAAIALAMASLASSDGTYGGWRSHHRELHRKSD